MREIYIILGWIGWLWLPCALLFAIGYLKGERDATRRAMLVIDHDDTATPSTNDVQPGPATK